MTFKIRDLGCKVNQYESQLIREQLLRAGFREAGDKPADIYVINTCTVTSSADSDSRGFIRQAMRENPKAKIVVAGCYVERNAQDIKNICKGAVIVKNDEKENILPVILSEAKDLSFRDSSVAPAGLPQNDKLSGITDFAGHNRAFVKVQDGCDNFCSYCKVPLVRGRSKSRDSASLIKEIKALAGSGFKEVVLCGICLGAFFGLIDLLKNIEAIKGLERIRLSSIEPAYVTKELIDAIASSEKICRHLHIPLQSGDSRILKAMNRNYTAAEYIKLIARIRARIPGVAITTDVLVGFPTETKKEFNNTLKTLKAIRPMRAHVFGFSKRELTRAFLMKGEIDNKEKSRRSAVVRKLVDTFAFSYAKKFKGKKVSVLVENTRDKKTGMLTGYTDTYIKILLNGRDSLANKITEVKIKDVFSGYSVGEIK